MAVHDFNSQRLFVDRSLAGGTRVTCTPEQASYLRTVLRLGDGAEILIFNGRDGEWRARLESGRQARRGARSGRADAANRRAARMSITCSRRSSASRLDYMVQKATETGRRASSCRSSRGIRWPSASTSDRMRANVIEAAEQCGVLRVPAVAEPLKLPALCWRNWDTASGV